MNTTKVQYSPCSDSSEEEVAARSLGIGCAWLLPTTNDDSNRRRHCDCKKRQQALWGSLFTSLILLALLLLGSNGLLLFWVKSSAAASAAEMPEHGAYFRESGINLNLNSQSILSVCLTQAQYNQQSTPPPAKSSTRALWNASTMITMMIS